MTKAAAPSDPTAAEPHAPPLWVVTGPTAAGKSALALQLAERLGLEILSMDSMAVYRGMDVGTAKPGPVERERVPHHLIDLVEPHETFDTARWCAAAAATLTALHARGRRALFVGGTPLYLMAFFKGMVQGPSADEALRAELEAREAAAPGTLHRELTAVDAAAAARIHQKDRRRLVRALEFHRLTGRAISSQRNHFDRPDWLRPCRIAAVLRSRDELHARVRSRTDWMLDHGLLDETRAIESGAGFSLTAGSAIGYAECRDFLHGRYKDREELRNRIRRSTHRLIRRQTTWLRRLPEICWLAPDAGADGLQRALETPVSGRSHR